MVRRTSPAAAISQDPFSLVPSNAAKHAPDATGVAITLSRNGDLRFEVRDDGEGFEAGEIAPGDGLLNMRDRMGAVGGRLEVRSAVGSGTTVIGTIPVRAP